MRDFIGTIDSDDDGAVQGSLSITKESTKKKQGKRKRTTVDVDEEAGFSMNGNFAFDSLGGGFTSGSSRRRMDAWDIDDPIQAFKKRNAPPRVDIDEIIARHKTQNAEAGDGDDLDALSVGSGFSSQDDDNEMGSGSENEGEETREDDGDSEDDEELVEDGLDASDEEAATLEQGDDVEDDGSQESDDAESKADVVLDDDDEGLDEDINAEAKQYFDQSTLPFDAATTDELAKDTHDHPFSSLPGSATLSRPILLGLASLSLTTPTPIQRQTIPLALLGKDLVASSVTGSGKTVGYMVPILERLTWRDRRSGPRTRVVILTPTRELAVQVHQVSKALARYTDLTFSLCVGGMALRTQEAELRTGPDVVIGTPGRTLDHIRNTRGWGLDSLEVLVLDEADRMLEEGFHDELEEIIQGCPRSRQTMLFSATVTEKVADLARLSLDKPVRVKVDSPGSTALGLTQEFLRVRDDRAKSSDGNNRLRDATLVAICRKVFNKGRTIVFFRSKQGAHRMKVIFGLCGLKAEELHGNLTQEQRLISLKRFKDGGVDYLLATDLASRGLDIKGVESVINYETPSRYDVYLHRIGRTARAGNTGRALTLAGESDRKLVKEAKKNAPPTMLKQRKLSSELVIQISNELNRLESSIKDILEEELEEKSVRVAEMQLTKGKNLIEFEDEIKSRPARTWFQNEQDKKRCKKVGTDAHNAGFNDESSSKLDRGKAPFRDKYSGLSRIQKRRKMANEEDAKDDTFKRSTNASFRQAKKAQQHGKIGTSNDLGIDLAKSRKASKNAKKKRSSSGTKQSTSFDVDKSSKSYNATKRRGPTTPKGSNKSMTRKPTSSAERGKSKR